MFSVAGLGELYRVKQQRDLVKEIDIRIKIPRVTFQLYTGYNALRLRQRGVKRFDALYAHARAACRVGGIQAAHQVFGVCVHPGAGYVLVARAALVGRAEPDQLCALSGRRLRLRRGSFAVRRGRDVCVAAVEERGCDDDQRVTGVADVLGVLEIVKQQRIAVAFPAMRRAAEKYKRYLLLKPDRFTASIVQRRAPVVAPRLSDVVGGGKLHAGAGAVGEGYGAAERRLQVKSQIPGARAARKLGKTAALPRAVIVAVIPQHNALRSGRRGEVEYAHPRLIRRFVLSPQGHFPVGGQEGGGDADVLLVRVLNEPWFVEIAQG